ncbi:LysR family transcriptional regulator [Streptomyces sp. NPDC046716]|uniref:LysR family transcriptional regulator n=1 Tax=Streptomyces sp. NPDC046716 TaxID=3157093 RepID=UPI0033D8A01E
MGVDKESRGGSSLDRLSNVDLNLLVPLLAVIEERSVTRAAERVGLTQPAMSHALGRLRRLLGDDLVVRQGRGVVLTPRALQLLAPVRQTLQQVADVVRFPGFDPATDRRTITVELTTSTAFVIGPRLGRLVAERAPHTVLRLRTITVPTEDTFTEHGVDVVLVSEGLATQYPRERLYDDRCVLVASPELPRELDAMELLTTQPHVVVDTGRRERVFPYPQLDEMGIGYRVGQLVSDYVLVPYLVGRGGGVALMRSRVAAEMTAAVDLRVEELPFRVAPLGIDMVWNPHLSDQGFVEWLRHLLFEAVLT